jgi:hypothetical protein
MIAAMSALAGVAPRHVNVDSVQRTLRDQHAVPFFGNGRA